MKLKSLCAAIAAAVALGRALSVNAEIPENVTFVLDAESRAVCRCGIKVKDDGIYVVKGFYIIVR